MISIMQRALVLTLATISFLVTPSLQAGTLGGGSWTYSPPRWLGGSFETLQFTRGSVTLPDADGTIVGPGTVDITEPDDFGDPVEGNCGTVTDPMQGSCTYIGLGTATFTGIIEATHGPAVGTAWKEIQLRFAPVEIKINRTVVPVGDSHYIEETRTVKLALDGQNDSGKLTNGWARTVTDPRYPRTGVYAGEDPNYVACDGSATSLKYTHCFSEISYGEEPYTPADIFQTIITASGETVTPNVGFYWDEACIGFPPGDLNLNQLRSEDQDEGYFRACEGLSLVWQTCKSPPPDTSTGAPVPQPVTCNAVDGKYYSFILTGVGGDRIEPAPEFVCAGDTVDAFRQALDPYVGTGKEVLLSACDPTQNHFTLPFRVISTESETIIEYSSSEGGKAVQDGFKIVGISLPSGLNSGEGFIQEDPDRNEAQWDLSDIVFDNIYAAYIYNLDDDVSLPLLKNSGEPLTALGGNGNDTLRNFSCGDGQVGNDTLIGSDGVNIFVIGAKLGQDTFQLVNASEGDKVVNISGATPTITANPDGTYTVALKGQNKVIVNVQLPENGEFTVFDAPNLSNFAECVGHPAY